MEIGEELTETLPNQLPPALAFSSPPRASCSPPRPAWASGNGLDYGDRVNVFVNQASRWYDAFMPRSVQA
jgi:hypothetical protein